ncbi:HNH endonuclease [Arthrobacter sp. CDRTa11]|uniref:HNH endonuclease n=1 Tax=Arthrobacter sp. CDRTa11 TaxID=2651199 RepID=UPI002265E3D3|nr:HNH endonuclease [Arthrobacter sp. CDRTa11]UZX02279.1 HNH endonuclease [Arthrobacter sp. CDRTa11]
MTAIILGWNPDRWNDWTYPAVLEEVAAAGLYVHSWNPGRRRNIPAGTDIWLVLQGKRGPGLIGHGAVAPAPGAGTPTMQVQVAFDALLPMGDHITFDVLMQATPTVPWSRANRSGLTVRPSEEANIRALWGALGPAPGPDPTHPVPGTYPGGAVSWEQVNRYERDPEARRACIAHRGTNCAACGFSFEVTYGEIGRDFIQVHHVVPVSELGNGYQLDPITDLVPLCANCHAMAHHGVSTPRTEGELRRVLAAAGFLRGTTVSVAELEAERAAKEILGLEK